MNKPTDINQSPHQNQPVLSTGDSPDQAEAAVVLVHGRGASAEDILTLVPEIAQPGFAYLAPQAAGGQWYPYRFMEPVERNEPWLSSALDLVGHTVANLEAEGIPAEKIVLLGFSQGACLVLEYAARNPRRYGGVVGLSGGLIGADEELGPYVGSLQGTPVFLGCSDIDPHIPALRVRYTAEAMQEMEGEVTLRLYRGMGHLVNQDEIDFVKGLLETLRKE
jgi:phospholipase/carboxylesterase